MFYCGITGKLSNPGDKPIRLVTERRHRTYEDDRSSEENGVDIKVSHGWEIVKEISVTLDGLRVWCDQNPGDVESAEAYVRLVKAEKAKRQAELVKGHKEAA
jgi:hypothetical protein